MIDPRLIDKLAADLRGAMPAAFVQEAEGTLRSLLDGFFARLNLVTREEFDIQVAVLARTREKLEALEKILAELERGGPPR